MVWQARFGSTTISTTNLPSANKPTTNPQSIQHHHTVFDTHCHSYCSLQMTNASGLAASIRGSTESSTFDLGGQNVTTITNNITSAFQDPLPIQEMIRITFVTGAGK